MLGWPQEAGFAFSSKNIQPLTSVDVLYSNSWSPSLSTLQPVSSWARSSAQSRPSLAVQHVLKHSCCSDKISHPLGCSSTLQLEKHTLLFHLARAATEYPPGCLCSQEGPCTPALQRMDRATHSIPSTPGASEELTTASRKLSWELKGYTTGFSAKCKHSVSSFLFSKKEGITPHTHHSHVGITHIWQQRSRVQQLSAQHGVHYSASCPSCLIALLPSREGAWKPPSSRSNSLMGKQI